MGLFDGSRKKAERGFKRGIQESEQLRDVLAGTFRDVQSQTPVESTLFKTGYGTLRDLLIANSQQDAAQAAARGLGGGEFAIAQGAERNNMAGRFLRTLLGQADASLQNRQQAATSNLMGAQGAVNNLRAVRYQTEEENRRRRNDRIASAVSNFVPMIPGMGQTPTTTGG